MPNTNPFATMGSGSPSNASSMCGTSMSTRLERLTGHLLPPRRFTTSVMRSLLLPNTCGLVEARRSGRCQISMPWEQMARSVTVAEQLKRSGSSTTLIDSKTCVQHATGYGVVASEEVKHLSADSTRQPHRGAVLVARADDNPVRSAEGRYLQEHGPAEHEQLLNRLFDELFPAE